MEYVRSNSHSASISSSKASIPQPAKPAPVVSSRVPTPVRRCSQPPDAADSTGTDGEPAGVATKRPLRPPYVPPRTATKSAMRLPPPFRLVALVALTALTALPLGCGDSSTDPGPDPDPDPPEPPAPIEGVLEFETVVSGLDDPIYLTAPPGDPRLFVVEQGGRILIVENGALLDSPFLDISDRVSSGGERGLFSVAFHPDYANNGFFYVDYTDGAGDTKVERYEVSADPEVADPATAVEILTVDQPFANHNGGQIAFGPDGMLYVALGDGGGGGDPGRSGQDLSTLLGSLLRIDVDGAAPFAIPPDNPFVAEAGARGEIWAYGLRNPWRFDFDPEGQRLYIADVGQNQLEEVNAVADQAAGVNYGWSVMEGRACFRPAAGCDQEGLTLPVLQYGHGEGCSVTGGVVYRGGDLPSVEGHYFYSDFCSGWVRSFLLVDGEPTEEREWETEPLGNVVSFGEDADGELN